MPQKLSLGRGAERQLGYRGDAMIAGLAADGDVRIAQLQENLARKQLLHAFDFLQAKDVGPRLLQEAGNQSGTQPDAIDIPGGDFDHWARKKRPTPAKVGRFAFSRCAGREAGAEKLGLRLDGGALPMVTGTNLSMTRR